MIEALMQAVLARLIAWAIERTWDQVTCAICNAEIKACCKGHTHCCHDCRKGIDRLTGRKFSAL